MRHDGLRLSRRLRAWFYGAFAVLYVTGAAWLGLKAWVTWHDPEALPHPAQPMLLKAHGAAAMIALVVLGTLLPLHVLRGWHARRNRTTGATMAALMLLLMVTGYGLYYAGDDSLRQYVRWAHDGAGLVLPVLLCWHIWCGRKRRRVRAASDRCGPRSGTHVPQARPTEGAPTTGG